MKTAKDSDTETKLTTGCASETADLEDTERQQWIAEAAYFISVARGHDSGGALDDWLAAEGEFERRRRKT